MKNLHQEVLAEYLEWVNQVTEDCDWKTEFTPEEIVSKVVDIVLNKLEDQGE